MLIVGTEEDRTGTKLSHEDSIVVIEVMQKAKDEEIYLMQNHIKSDPTMQSGAYFVTSAQLEATIVGYETGLWLDTEMLDQ